MFGRGLSCSFTGLWKAWEGGAGSLSRFGGALCKQHRRLAGHGIAQRLVGNRRWLPPISAARGALLARQSAAVSKVLETGVDS